MNQDNQEAKPQHTDGEWHVSESGMTIMDQRGRIIAITRFCPDAPGNARLMATSPTLLEVLEHIVANSPETLDGRSAALAVIAKARGEAE